MEQNCNRFDFHAYHYMVLFPCKALGGGGGGGGGGGVLNKVLYREARHDSPPRSNLLRFYNFIPFLKEIVPHSQTLLRTLHPFSLL